MGNGSKAALSAMSFTLRAFDPARDYERVAELIATSDSHDGLDSAPSADELRHAISVGGWYEPDRDTQVAAAGDEVVGFIRVSSRVRSRAKVVHRIEVQTRPTWRRRGIARALVAWAEGRSAAMRANGEIGAPGMPHEMAGSPDDVNEASRAFALALGYHPIRYSLEMVRDLREPIPDAVLPAGLELRPVVEADHRRIWDANVEAFLDHFEPGAQTDDDFRAQFALPDLDTSLWVIAWDGGEVAGVVFNMIFATENEQLGARTGWLADVSVRRPWRRRGLATALITESLRRLRDRGMDDARLGVDAENPTGALGVYERLGFRRLRAHRLYRKTI